MSSAPRRGTVARVEHGSGRGHGDPWSRAPILPAAARRERPVRRVPSWSAWYRSRHSERWSLPDEVFGSVPGRTSTTSTGGTPTASETVLGHGVAHRCGVVVGLGLGDDDDRLAALRRRSLPNAITLPARTPSTAAAARSTSSGNTLRPPTMITSLSRPHTTSSPSTRYARSPVRSHPSWNARGGGLRVAVVAGRHRRAAHLELADLAVAELARRSPGRTTRSSKPAQRAAEQRPAGARRRRPSARRGVALVSRARRGRRCRRSCPRRAPGT